MMMRNWEELLPDLLDNICNFLSVFEDLVSFGGVCAAWRKVAIQQNGGHPLLPLPCLMLAEKETHEDSNNKGQRDFYSLVDKKVYSLELPEIKGKLCMETKGWLVTISGEGEMSLVHPVTRQQISLPHLSTFEYYDDFLMDYKHFERRAVLSSRNPNSSDCVLMAILGSGLHLGFCKPGDKAWTVIEDEDSEASFQLAIEYYRGKFYAADIKGNVRECDMLQGSNKSNPVTIRIIGRIPYDLLKENQIYLVESAGHLLIVTREYGTSEFKVFEFDTEQGSLKEVNNLGSRSIFLGYSASLSVDSHVYPELLPNSIYFTDDCCEAFPLYAGKDMGIYDLSQKSISTHYPSKTLSRICPPIWTFLASLEMRSC